MAIKCYYCKGTHELVSQVKDCAAIPAAFAAKAAEPTAKPVEVVVPDTVKKITVPAHRTSAAYLALKAKIQPVAETETVMVKIPGLDVSVPAPVKTIDQQVAKHDAALAEIKKGQDLELGMYQYQGEVYKVHMNKYNTHKMASKLVITNKSFFSKKTGTWEYGPKGKFLYAKGFMVTLTSEHKMTEEMAKEFHDATKLKYGQDYGFCCVCGKLLTNKNSIAKGIGPVCGSSF